MDTVLTFDPHPLAVIAPHALPKLLQTFPLKRDLIAGLGVEDLVVIPFDRSFAEHSAEQFVEEVLIGRLNASHVAVGENFRFGKGAKGDAEFLRSRAEFETRVVPLVEVAGETVSSSHIRGLVAAGDVKAAGEFLGGRSCSRARSCTATSAAASWACRRRTSSPTTAGRPRPRRLRRLGARPPGGDQRRRAARRSRPAAAC